MKNNNIGAIISKILAIVSIIAIIVSVIWGFVFQCMNPDMTEMRLFLENPYPTVIAIGAMIMLIVGKVLIDDNI